MHAKRDRIQKKELEIDSVIIMDDKKLRKKEK